MTRKSPEWLRVGLGTPYFSLLHLGDSRGLTDAVSHLRVLAHPAGSGRSKLWFTVPADEFQGFLKALQRGIPGDARQMTLARNRGRVMLTVAESGLRKVEYEIAAGHGTQGARGTVAGEFRAGGTGQAGQPWAAPIQG